MPIPIRARLLSAGRRMTDPSDIRQRARMIRRKNRIMLFVLLGFVVSVIAYSAFHIRSEMNMSTPAAGAAETGK